MTPVTAVIITHNEEQNLKMTLPKLFWCNEIVIVDSGSTDHTLNICKQYNCNIHFRKFDNFGNQKRFAVSLAKNDWILNLDADEVLSDALVDELCKEMKAPAADGYSFRMKFVFLNKIFHHGKEANRYFLRLFNKTKGNFNSNFVHEAIEVNGQIKKLKQPIYHYSYRNLDQYFDKQNKYTSLGADMSFSKGKNKTMAGVVFSIPIYFFKYYFLEKNFLNGRPGFNWSVLSAYYHFAKYIKLRELWNRHSLALSKQNPTSLSKNETNNIASNYLDVREDILN